MTNNNTKKQEERNKFDNQMMVIESDYDEVKKQLDAQDEALRKLKEDAYQKYKAQKDAVFDEWIATSKEAN